MEGNDRTRGHDDSWRHRSEPHESHLSALAWSGPLLSLSCQSDTARPDILLNEERIVQGIHIRMVVPEYRTPPGALPSSFSSSADLSSAVSQHPFSFTTLCLRQPRGLQFPAKLRSGTRNVTHRCTRQRRLSVGA